MNASSVIEGERVAGGRAFTSTSPWSGEAVAAVRAAGESDVRRAVEVAMGPEWAELGWAARGDVLARIARATREAADELAALTVSEVGKPIAEARAEVERVARVFEFYAQEGRRAKGSLIPADEPGVSVLTRRCPLGPVALITPWNFPLAIPAWKMAPALLCGNPVVWKPSSQAVACASAFTEVVLGAGLPPAALALLVGGAEVAGELLEQPLAGVSFTGSLIGKLQVGVIAINRPSTGLEVQAPFGGWKDSGGSDPEQGTEAIRFFTKSQTIYWKSDADAELP